MEEEQGWKSGEVARLCYAGCVTLGKSFLWSQLLDPLDPSNEILSFGDLKLGN